MSGTLSETRDLHVDGDMNLQASEVSGVRALAERLLRRLTTPRGMYPWWPNDGYDARDALLSKQPLWRIKTDIEAECVKDEQCLAAVATVVVSPSGTEMSVFLTIDTEQGEYELTMGIAQAAATLIAIEKSV